MEFLVVALEPRKFSLLDGMNQVVLVCESSLATRFGEEYVLPLSQVCLVSSLLQFSILTLGNRFIEKLK